MSLLKIIRRLPQPGWNVTGRYEINMPKRFIEDVLPLTELNKTAQTGGGVGSFNAMHPYFARRPLTASRAMTLAALVNAPESDGERQYLAQLLTDISQKEWLDDPAMLEKAQNLIRESHGGRAPRCLDPFAGGGSMPLEAMRLGCEATALDLNPVAYLALIGSLVYPQKYGKQWGEPARSLREEQPDYEANTHSPQMVMPAIKASLKRQKKSECRLVEDVRYWADWVLTQAQAQIGDCFPSDPDGAVPAAYLWAKTITCPYCHGEIPLVKRFWLQQGEGEGETDVAYRLDVNRDTRNYTVEILHGALARQSQPGQGTMRGATIECIYCGMPSERDEIVAQSRAGKLSQHLMVVVLKREGKSGRDFRQPTEKDQAAYNLATERLREIVEDGFEVWGLERMLSPIPDEPLPPEGVYGIGPNLYGVNQWGMMFNSRQNLVLITLGKLIRTVRDLLGQKDTEYAKAVSLYLGFILAKQAVYNSKAAWWQPGGLKVAPVMARHDIPMTWDYVEASLFSGLAASWDSFINALLPTLENVIQSGGLPAKVVLGSAKSLPLDWTGTFDAVICDPPYYHSVPYASLSDYFYPWHKRVVGEDYPEAFVTEVTPKEEELVQEAVYHGGTQITAKQFYEDGMAKAFCEMQRVLRPDGIAVIMFAHKSSSAWETLVGALIRAGFQVTASWPLNTEGRRLQSYRAVALASSVYLVCRKRQGDAPGQKVGYLEDIQADLRRTIRRYLERFWEAGIGGADFFMSAIGPGLSVFSRFEKIERYDGSRVTVTDFLNLVRHEVASFAIERIVGEEGFGERVDQPTQFYLLWRWGYNDWDVPDGESVLLSTAVGIDLKILMDRFGLVERVKGKLRLLSPEARASRLERVTERVAAGGAVPLIDVLHKACLLWQVDNQEELSALVAERGGEMWPVAQAMVELLPRDSYERKALMSMLGIRGDLESRAQRWAEANPSRHKPEPKQLGLWGEEEADSKPRRSRK
jgi:putative DNA methylase